MPTQLNHTIVWCSDKVRSSAFLCALLGLPQAKPFSNFLVVEMDNGVSLDFMEKEGPVAMQHYAFLVDDATFDAGFAQVRSSGKPYWADPARGQVGEINHHWGGRGVYFEDPDGHLLELITKPYGAMEAM